MILEIPEAKFNPKELIPEITGGGMSNTNGMPLILFLKDKSVLKVTFHFKSEYDLALERRNEKPKQWQGVNGILIGNIIQEKVPGPNGLGEIYDSYILVNQTKKIVKKLNDEKDCPVYMKKYFELCQSELDNNGGYDEIAIVHMKEYYGFLSNLYKSPSMNGFYEIMINSALFEVAFFYFKIKKYLPGFKHNDLHMENIMIDPREQVESLMYTKYEDDEGNVFYVPYFGYELKIIDLGLSELPEYGIESVLKNSVSINKTIETGLETKLLLRFISFGYNWGSVEGVEEKYSKEGFKYDSKLFDKFKAKKNDPRENAVIKTISF